MLNERYYSHLHNIEIPLYGFKHFHYANNCEDDIEDFIGRSSIVDKLSAWLKDTSPKYSGAYLVTGYRGMGKSSFVYEAIKKLKDDSSKAENKRCVEYVTIPINVGNELLSAKELLGMMCKVGYYNYVKATQGKKWFTSKKNTIIVALPIIVVALFTCISFAQCERTISRLVAGMSVIVVLLSGYIANAILYLLWLQFGWKCLITTSHIKRSWRGLLQRIDAELSKSSEFSIAKEDIVKEVAKGITPNFGFRTEVKYPIADVPEMQEMMVRLLDLINESPYTKLRFIFVIDELDKISPKDDEKQIMPEYDVLSKGKNINTEARNRQNALANLMANMKYFISSSKAKFVFVTGYDMYEATLSDISNREFNIHSIFSGHINVSSFFRHTEKYSGVDSMIEEYLCHLLMAEEKDGQRKSLKDYVRYVRKDWTGISNETREDYQRVLDRRIVFLRCFLTYLIYMSNGSPKKLAMYIEKYIRTKEKVAAKARSKGENFGRGDERHLGMDECDYYLYFDNRNIQRIAFVDYLIYPMIQNLVDKSNIYNDKLLVSTSFMLSNLYKFHKSGFSMRNLEYMPELLDINKMPELRDFIGGIVNFLTQTHVDEASINLYKYKFPLRLSEEITFYSKTSEEISYLFNFSHDELLSVKKLYMYQIKHYRDNGGKETKPLASLHHTLGDIYMLEEDYELAIYEYQEALTALWRQTGEKTTVVKFDKFSNSQKLFYIRLSLKLGLAYEKRKTYDTAYLAYEQLTDKLIENAEKINKAKLPSPYPKVDTETQFYLFRDVRIMYLAPLAKLYVLEKMDLGGFTDENVKRLNQEIRVLFNFKSSKSRAISQIDFFTKLGDIMYYRNSTNNKWYYRSYYWYYRAISVFIDMLKNKNAFTSTTYAYSTALVFLEILSLDESKDKLQKELGTALIKRLTNALVGISNCYLSRATVMPNESGYYDVETFFSHLNSLNVLRESPKVESIQIQACIKNLRGNIPHFMRSILFYWDCAMMYEAMDEYKSAHCIYVQMLDAIYTYFHVQEGNNVDDYNVGNETLEFCKYLAVQSIQNSYKHYGHINMAEIDKIKGILNSKQTTDINLDYLSNISDIEIVLYKYYMICFLSEDEDTVNDALRSVVNARQLGGDKIISSVTQDVENLYFKEQVNEQILFLLIPELKVAFYEGEHSIYSTLTFIGTYLCNSKNCDKIVNTLGWGIYDKYNDNGTDYCNPRFAILQYLVTDSLFCLNKITDILSPLYSTALYSNTFIAECYEKVYIWNHILLAIRDIIICPKTVMTDKIKSFSNDFIRRYKLDVDKNDAFIIFRNMVNHLGIILDKDIYDDEYFAQKVENLYAKISPNGHRFLTSSYSTSSCDSS